MKLSGKPEEFQIKPTQQPQDSSETVLFPSLRTLFIKGNHVLGVEAEARQVSNKEEGKPSSPGWPQGELGSTYRLQA